ncbi:hypothetical protein, partial [Bartonella sp. CL45QHWL]|uniref:hypothetical protein n=1 Tax=Bartonella sp. CL45QHWL TaxID=3243533 RepID=UPI0035D084C1
DKSVAITVLRETTLIKFGVEYFFFIRTSSNRVQHHYNVRKHTRQNPCLRTSKTNKSRQNSPPTIPLSLRHRPKISATTSNLEKSPTLLARGIQAKKSIKTQDFENIP